MAEFTQDMLGTAAGTMGVSQEEIPLAMRIAGSAPGILTAAGYMNYRGANTLLEGGRFDYLDAEARGLKGRKARRIQAKYRVFDSNNSITPMNTRQYVGSQGPLLGNRAARRVNANRGSTFNLRASMASFRPGAARRHGTLTSYMDPRMGIYSPYSISGIASNFGPVKRRMASRLTAMQVADVADSQTLLGPGLLSFISAGTKADRLERKALKGNRRALSKLGRVDRNIPNLLTANNPQILARTSASTGFRTISGSAAAMSAATTPLTGYGTIVPQATLRANAATRLATPLYPGAPGYGSAVTATRGAILPPQTVTTQIPGSPSMYDDAARGMVSGKGAGQVGVRGNLLASSMPGQYGQMVAGYFRGAMGFADVAGLGAADSAASKGAQLAVQHLAGSGATKYMAKGAKLVGLAIPGLNILAAASLAYDIGNMAGQVVKSGINLGRDATKSMQGSINKPLFGMGYKDTEAAATSRQRGVMAIQNSRLNARSMLGSEAGMLAARYG